MEIEKEFNFINCMDCLSILTIEDILANNNNNNKDAETILLYSNIEKDFIKHTNFIINSNNSLNCSCGQTIGLLKSVKNNKFDALLLKDKIFISNHSKKIKNKSNKNKLTPLIEIKDIAETKLNKKILNTEIVNFQNYFDEEYPEEVINVAQEKLVHIISLMNQCSKLKN